MGPDSEALVRDISIKLESYKTSHCTCFVASSCNHVPGCVEVPLHPNEHRRKNFWGKEMKRIVGHDSLPEKELRICHFPDESDDRGRIQSYGGPRCLEDLKGEGTCLACHTDHTSTFFATIRQALPGSIRIRSSWDHTCFLCSLVASLLLPARQALW